MTPVNSATSPGVTVYTPTDSGNTNSAAHIKELANQPHHKYQIGKRGLTVFRAEMIQALKSQFASLSEASAPAAGYADSTSVAQTSGEILAMAKIALRSDGESRTSLVLKMRQSMSQALVTTRQAAPAAEDSADVDAAAQAIDEGLGKLEAPESRSITASMTTMDAVNKQRTSLRIRTQEGDFVRLELKRVDFMSATDFAVDDGDRSLTYTELQVSSRSKLMLRVEGDLNEAELAAIQDVFAQAEQLAEEFFSGDIEAALDVVANLEFDTEQLAGVSLKFRALQASSISHSFVESRLPAVIAEEPAPVAEDTPAAVAPEPAAPAQPAPDPPAVIQPVPADAADFVEQPDASAELPVSPFVTLLDFFAQLAKFLDDLAARIDPVPQPQPPDASQKFDFTLPVKIDILKAAFTELAPPDVNEKPESTVDRLIDVVRPPLD